MPRLPILFVVVLSVLLLAVPGGPGRWDFDVEIPYGDADDPFSEDALRARLERIAPLVGEVVGDEIPTDHLRIVLADGGVEAERILREEHPHLLDTSAEEHSHAALVITSSYVQMRLLSLLGRYDLDRATIELYPALFEYLAPADPRALLDVVFAHELAHVWQDRRFGVFRHEDVERTTEQELARAAAIEGSAEFISREVARRLGCVATFDLVGVKRDEDLAQGATAPVQRALGRWRTWAYGDGLHFVETVHEALGPAGTWERVLGSMPQDVWSVAHPDAWLRRHDDHVEDLDDWCQRLLWCLGPESPYAEFKREWGTHPLLPDDLRTRLERAGLATSLGPWATCRGGALVAGTPERGALAGAPVLMHVWRFPTTELAVDAREALDAALLQRGSGAWAIEYSGEVVGLPHMRRSTGDARAVSSFVLGSAPLHAQEGCWASRVHGALLLEILCLRDGASPALLDLLETAVLAKSEPEAIDAARHGRTTGTSPWAMLAALRLPPLDETEALPDTPVHPAPLRDELIARHLAESEGTSEVLQWLLHHPLDAAAWLTALGPAAGREEYEKFERGPILRAALDHDDDDVKCFALGAVAEQRCVLGPWDARVLARIHELTAHADAFVRSAAIRAAHTLVEEGPLAPDRIDALVDDPSPAVRASLAASRKLLGQRTRRAMRSLSTDPHAAVRRAATTEVAEKKGFFDRLTSELLAAAIGGPETREAERDDRTDSPAAYEFMLRTAFQQGMGRESPDLARRLRSFLGAEEVASRLAALQTLQFVGELRALFLPEMVGALTRPETRIATMTALCAGGLDLEPARDHLLRMLEHPRWRADILRVLASNEISVPADVLSRVHAWLDSEDLLLRSAASLLALRLEPEDPRPLEILDAAWDRLPTDWRIQVWAAASTCHPEAEITGRMLLKAVRSPYFSERHAVDEAAKGKPYDEVYLGALLGTMEHANHRIAGGYWSAFLWAVHDLEGEDKARASDVLARHVRGWCDAGRLPVIGGDVLDVGDCVELEPTEDLVAALDDCLVRDDPSLLRFALATIRRYVDTERFPLAPPVREAMSRLLSLDRVLGPVPTEADRDLLPLYLDIETASPDAVRSALLEIAAGRLGELGADVETLLSPRSERLPIAIDLVEEFLETGTRASVRLALEIVEIAGPQAAHLLPRLRELAADALPSQRGGIELVIEDLEQAD